MDSLVEKLLKLGIEPMGSEEFKPFSDEQIAAVEASLAIKLPASYKTFLSRFGSSLLGTCVSSTVTGEVFLFGWFFNLTELMDAINNLKELLPENIIPIGADAGGLTFCLGVSGESFGKVYVNDPNVGWYADAEKYLERGEPVPSDIRYHVVQEIAPSFEDFIYNMENASAS